MLVKKYQNVAHGASPAAGAQVSFDGSETSVESHRGSLRAFAPRMAMRAASSVVPGAVSPKHAASISSMTFSSRLLPQAAATATRAARRAARTAREASMLGRYDSQAGLARGSWGRVDLPRRHPPGTPFAAPWCT